MDNTNMVLMKAFAGECQARTRYDLAAQTAASQQMGFISRMLRFTAEQEKEHAQIFYDLLVQNGAGTVQISGADYPVMASDDIAAFLRSSQKSEYHEHDEVYPAFAETARREGREDIAQIFMKTACIEKSHGDRFGCFAELLENSAMFRGNEDTEWICLNCGHIFTGSDVPEKCPVCSHAQGFFVPYKYYCFIAEKYSVKGLC